MPRPVAAAGKRSLLSVSVQFYAEPELLFNVEREAFDPPPRVRSAVLRIRRRAAPAVEVPSEDRGAKAWLESCEIDPTRRAATLTLEEWARLAWSREESVTTAAPDRRGGRK